MNRQIIETHDVESYHTHIMSSLLKRYLLRMDDRENEFFIEMQSLTSIEMNCNWVMNCSIIQNNCKYHFITAVFLTYIHTFMLCKLIWETVRFSWVVRLPLKDFAIIPFALFIWIIMMFFLLLFCFSCYYFYCD